MSPSWDSLEQQLSATCWATQAMPSSQKRLGELQLPLTGQLVAQTEKCFLPSYPSLPHRAQTRYHSSHHSSFRHIGTSFLGRELGPTGLAAT